jgi:hypothetical protein
VGTRHAFLSLNRPVREANFSAQPKRNHLQNTVPIVAVRLRIKAKLHKVSGTEGTIALTFIFHISAICSYVHRDTEEVPDTTVSR